MTLASLADTARWMAFARAMESERPDALFHDAHARELAGEAGAAIMRRSGAAGMIARAIAVRTAVMDELILRQLAEPGVDLVLNLAAGFDTRPWRLALPASLRWIEVDLAETLAAKAAVLGRDAAACRTDSIAADITDPAQLAQVLARSGASRRALVICEGLLVYLAPAQVTALARSLHAWPPAVTWLADITGPRALEALQRIWGPLLQGARFQFAPADAPAFFGRLGWQERVFRSSQEEARRLGRETPTPLLGRMLLRLAPAAFREEMRRLSGCALFERGAPGTAGAEGAGAGSGSAE